MVGRVILGQRSGTYGAWVSKPGVNVVSASTDQLLLSTDVGNVQVVAAGVIGGQPSSGTVISFVDLGFQPRVIVSSPRFQYSFSYLSNSAISLTFLGTNNIVAAWNVGAIPNIPAQVSWVVLNIPRA